MFTVSVEQADAILDRAFLTPDAVRADYSGRGMYGASCLGFRVNRDKVYALVVAVAELSGRAMMEDAREDDMGLDRIIYFPSYACPEWSDTKP